MGILSVLDRATGIATKAPDSEIIPRRGAYYDGTEAAHPKRYGDLPQAYRVHSWVYACVNVIARSIAGVPIKAVRGKAGSGPIAYKGLTDCRWEDSTHKWAKAQDAKILDNHWLLDVLRDPMPTAGMTGYEMLQGIVTYLETAGNAYVEKIFTGQNKARVKRLWSKIDPRHVWVIPGQDRLIQGYLWRGSGMGKPVVFNWDEIMQFSYFNPENPYYGLAPIMTLKQTLVGDLRAADWNRMFFENGAVPEIVLETDQKLTASQADELQARWDNRYQGVRRSHKTAVMHSGASLKPVGDKHKDMDFLDLRHWTKEEVAGVLGVPLFLIGERDKLNRATSQSELRSFWDNTLIPRLVKIEAVLNQSLVPPGENVYLFFDLSGVEALRDDLERKARIWRLRKEQGVTINEMRQAWGLPEGNGSGMNAVYVPQNMIPIGEVAPQKSKAMTKDVNDSSYLPAPNLEAQRAVHEAHIPGIYLLGTGRAVETLQEMDVEVPADWEARFNFQDRIDRYMREEIGQKITKIDETTRERIGNIIDDGMKQGKGAKAIAKNIRDEFQAMGKTRSNLIARQEGSTAISNGQHELYKATQVPYHAWHCQFMNSRETHMDAHNRYSQGIPLSQMFYVGAGEGPGPRMIGLPEEDINCYCVELPMMKVGESKDLSTIKGFEDWVHSLEDEGKIKDYERGLRKWFGDEEKRYVDHWLMVSGGNDA